MANAKTATVSASVVPAAASTGKAAGKGTKLVLPPALGSYANIFQPREIEGSQSGPKYSISLLWPKSEPGLAAIKRIIEQVAVAKFGPVAKQWLAQPGSKFHNPLRDGSIEKPEDPIYADKMFINASTKNRPGLVDNGRKTGKPEPIFEEEEAYSGCVFRASVSFYAFEKAGKKGVGVGLNNLQVVRKGARIDGRQSAESEFSAFVDEGEGEGEGEGGEATGTDDLIS